MESSICLQEAKVSFVPASKMRLRRGLGYPTQITVPYVFTACNPTLQKKILHMHSHAIASLTTAELRGRQVGYEDNPNGLWVL